MTLNSSNLCWRVVVMPVPTNSKRTLFEPNFNCSSQSSAVKFGSIFESLFVPFCMAYCHGQAPSTSWKCGSDPGILGILMDIIFGSRESISLHTIVFHRGERRVGPICLSRALMVGKQSVLLMHGLVEYGWPGCNRLGRGGGAVWERNAIGLPMISSGPSGWAGQLQYLQTQKHSPFLQSLLRILMIDGPVA